MDADNLTADRLRALLSYNPETGEFHWAISARGIRRGRRTGCLDKSTGYIVIRVDGKKRYAQRLAWLYVTGEWPNPGVDHWDKDKTNNRFANLREADKAENAWNTGMPATNTSGSKGVSFHKATGKFRADIKVRNQPMFLGLFVTFDEARAAWRDAARKLHEEFGRDQDGPLRRRPARMRGNVRRLTEQPS